MGKHKTLAEDHRRILTDEFHCDVNFVVGDDEAQQVIRAHKLILASRSKVFTAMFYGELKETGENVKLTDTKGGILKQFLEYLYTDSTYIDKENVGALLYLATKYDVQNLVEACHYFCCSNLTQVDEVCYMMNLATTYKLTHLWKACIQLIVMNSMLVFPSDYLNEMDTDTMKRFVACDELAVEEILIFECLRSWAVQECSRQTLKYNIANERSVFGQNIYSIRFPIIKSHYFTDKIATTNILTAEEELDVYRSMTSSNHALKYFSKCPRLNIQNALGWTGSYLNKNKRKLVPITRLFLKSLILHVSVSGRFYIQLTSQKSTHSESSDINDIYEIECPEEYINKYFLVCFQKNAVFIERETNMELRHYCGYGDRAGKIEISNVFEDIKDDDELNKMFSLTDRTTINTSPRTSYVIKAFFYDVLSNTSIKSN